MTNLTFRVDCKTALALLLAYKILKGRMHYFSMQVVIIKCFLNPEKKLAQIRFVVFEKNAHFNSEQ